MKNYTVKHFMLFTAVTAALLFTGLLFGCTQTGAVDTPAQTGKEKAPIHFTDHDGREILLDGPCSRIISLYSAHTENLFSLGAGDLLIGDHRTSIYPPDTQEIPTYDYNDDPETLIAAEPDLVLIRPYITRRVPEFVKALEMAGIPLVSLYPEKFAGFEDYINKLALLTGTEDAAAEQLAQFYHKLEEITGLTKNIADQQNIFFEATTVNLRTVAADSLPATAIALAGGVNVAADAKPIQKNSSIASFGEERILALADEIDVYVSQRGAMNANSSLQTILARPGFETIKAVQNRRVYIINEKIISSPTFRFHKGVRELARYLFPEIIDDLSPYRNNNPATKRDFANIMVRQFHMPIYVPSSANCYQENTGEHTYGCFADLTWQDEDFDCIETVTLGGYIPYAAGNDGKQFFKPAAPVTREMLAKAVFMLGAFKPLGKGPTINDLDQCTAPDLVQALVDSGVFSLHHGNFEPQRTVTNNEIIEALSAVSYTAAEEVSGWLGW
ncbi:MAG: ABC transporter substrate-binding protein [Firmicutes bacterium]|nr:ABC transporter substrate-binding protein [Bacillota bacterium]